MPGGSWCSVYSILASFFFTTFTLFTAPYPTKFLKHKQRYCETVKLSWHLVSILSELWIRIESGYGSGYWSGSIISSESGSGSRVLMTKNWRKKYSRNFVYIFFDIFMSKLQERRLALKNNIQHLKKSNLLTFFYVCGSFLPSWIPGSGLRIWIRSRIQGPYWIRIRIHSTASYIRRRSPGRGCESAAAGQPGVSGVRRVLQHLQLPPRRGHALRARHECKFKKIIIIKLAFRIRIVRNALIWLSWI